MWFVKKRRAQSIEDYETWQEGGVTPTLNVMDNNGDTRATVLIFYGNRVDDIRMQGEVINTLSARMGTGGNNMPLMAEVIGTLQARDYKGVGNQYVAEGKVITQPMVRRLTPRECERLQGFPDDWTASQSDSQRYKQMGNAVAVPVVQWIVDRLVTVNDNLNG